MIKNLELVRDFFLKCFILGFIFQLIFSLFYIFGINWAADFSHSLYGIEKELLIEVSTFMLGFLKIIILSFGLIPTIALHCMVKKLKKAEK